MDGNTALVAAFPMHINGVLGKKARKLVHLVMGEKVREVGVEVLDGQSDADACSCVHNSVLCGPRIPGGDSDHPELSVAPLKCGALGKRKIRRRPRPR